MIKGLRRREGTTFHRRNEARAEVERLGIETRLLLRQIDANHKASASTLDKTADSLYIQVL